MLQTKENGTSISTINNIKQLIAFSTIKITKGTERFAFGGSQESLDHIKGNTGESWHVIVSLDEQELNVAHQGVTLAIIYVGIIFTLLTAVAAFFLGKLAARPIVELAQTAQSLGQGHLDTRALVHSDDEIGILSQSLNKMAKNFQGTIIFRDKLMSDVEQKTIALEKAKNEAEEANRAKGIFIANMSHEFRTPLNAVLGFSQEMLNDQTLPDSYKENLKIINRSGEHLLTLINDVLEMSKIEAGRLFIEPKAIDLGELVRNIIDMMENRAEAKHLKLLFEQSSMFPRFVSADAPKLRQIIINLLSNAVKFTDVGGVTLRLGVEQQEDESQLKLVCEVEDSGVGLSAEEQQKIFKPFIQVGHVDKQTGTGLGLAITKQYVELMGGELKVVSEPAKGSLFSFSIIVDIANENDIEKTLPVKGKVIGLESGQPEYRILSVEDQWENQLLLLNLLELVGFKVRCVANGEEAIAAFAEWHPHLIWMDRRMPVMDGLEATRQIRKMNGGAKVSIIALTASVFEEQMSEVINAGLDDFIRKPYKSEEIYECMVKHLGVRFIYDDDMNAADEHVSTDLTPEVLHSIPENLRSELYEAAIELDMEISLSIIEKIRDKDAQVADELALLVDRFDFKTLKQILDGEK